MKIVFSKLIPVILATLLLQSCYFYAVVGILRTIQDINYILKTINSSLINIQTVLKEGKDLKRAAEDGKLISTLAEKIPGLIRNQVEKATSDKIHLLSGDLKTTALNFAKYAVEENLKGACQSYNEMTEIYNQFTDIMAALSQTANPASH